MFKVVVAPIDDGDFGRMYFDDRKLAIDPRCLKDKTLLRETIRHEMWHASTHVSGVAYMEKYDEESIARMMETIFFPAWDRVSSKLNMYENK